MHDASLDEAVGSRPTDAPNSGHPYGELQDVDAGRVDGSEGAVAPYSVVTEGEHSAVSAY